MPAGVHGGDYLSVILPGGRPVRILLPADASAGTRLRVLHEHDALPAADSVPGVPAPSHVRLARSVCSRARVRARLAGVPDVAHVLHGWNAAAAQRAIGCGYAEALHQLVAERICHALRPSAGHRCKGALRAGRLNARGDTRVVRDLYSVPHAYVIGVLAPHVDEMRCTRDTVCGAWHSLSSLAAVFDGVEPISRQEGIVTGGFPSAGMLCPGVRASYEQDGRPCVCYVTARSPAGDTVTLYLPRRRQVRWPTTGRGELRYIGGL